MLRPIDIIDRYGRPTGQKSNPEEANDQGLWHLGAHVFVYTPSRRVLVQKRSQDTMKHAGMLEIGVGGFVDSGESPEEAAVRELREETGLDVPISALMPLSVTRYNHRWRFKHKMKISRVILHNYAVRLPQEHNYVQAEPDEVDWIGFLPLTSVRWLIRKGSLKRLGKLSPIYAYYRKMLIESESLMQRAAESEVTPRRQR